jgi:hypothetical protein
MSLSKKCWFYFSRKQAKGQRRNVSFLRLCVCFSSRLCVKAVLLNDITQKEEERRVYYIIAFENLAEIIVTTYHYCGKQFLLT